VYRKYLNKFDGHHGKVLIWSVPLLIVVTAALHITTNDGELWWPIAMTGVFLLAGVYLLLFFRVTRVTAAPGRLEVRNAFGHVRTFTASQLSRAVIMSDYSQPLGYVWVRMARFIVLGSHGKQAMSWLSSAWSPHQMDELSAALAIPTDHIDGTMDATKLRRRYPHSVPLWVAHIFLTAIIITGIIVVLAGAAIAIDIAVGSP
jgi:hypothetical protein